MRTDEPAVGICVTTFRRPELFIKMILQIKERTLYKNYKVYIIIDHEKDRATLKKIKESKIVELLPIEKIEMFPSPVECVKVVNRSYSIGDEPYFVWLNDDMEVEEGWLQEAMKCMQTFPNREGLVTFQDGIQDGRKACAGLISRNYIKTKLKGIFHNEIYKHYYADTELYRKSRMMDMIKYCPTSIVWHNHPSAKGRHEVKADDVYTQSMLLWERDRRVFNSRKEKNFEETIPIFIITRDRREVLKQSIQSYYDYIKTPFEIVIVDFGSTHKPTLKYLKGLERKKVKVYWKEKIYHKYHFNKYVDEAVQDYFKNHPKSNYVVTDPDIALDNVKGDILGVYAHFLERLDEIVVVGPMLRVDDIPNHYPKRKEVFNWEMRHNPPIKRVKRISYKGKTVRYISARIDTTFAMNRAGTHWRRYSKAVRVLSPYAARHLDWYLDPQNLTPDQKYYMKHASRKITHWSQWDKEA